MNTLQRTLIIETLVRRIKAIRRKMEGIKTEMATARMYGQINKLTRLYGRLTKLADKRDLLVACYRVVLKERSNREHGQPHQPQSSHSL